jgi:hypothetical protein
MQKDWIDVLVALMTPTIAIVGSFLAYQQWKINRTRLRHELYDRRMAVYSKLMNYLSAILQEASFPRDAFSEWLPASYEGFFLFDDRLHTYIERLNAKSRAFRSNCRKMKSKCGKCNEDEWKKLCDEDAQLNAWFDKQFDVAKKEFGRFLRIDT